MSRKSTITIAVGLLIFTATHLISNLVLNTIAPPPSVETSAYTQERIERLQLAETIQTTFQFVEILELLVAGALAYQWRKSGIPDQSKTDDREEDQKKTFSTLVRVSVITGIVAFATSYIALLFDVFVFNLYGGLGSNVIICPGIPAGLFGMLGGAFWYKTKKKSSFAPIDLIPLTLIGIVAGIIPGACVNLLPQ